MKLTYILFSCLIFALFIAGCKKREPAIPEGSIDLSDLKTKQDYYLPFALLNDTNTIRMAILNGDTTDFTYGSYIVFKESGFYELVLVYEDPLQEKDTFMFTTKTEEREYSEWGIRSWVPAKYDLTTMGSEDIVMYYPHRFADSVQVPFIFFAMEAEAIKAVYCKGKGPGKKDMFNMKRGVGSVNISSSAISSQVRFSVDGRQLTASLSKISIPDMEMQGTINSATVIPANSLVRIKGNLDITSAGSLTVNEGAVILIDEAVDINASGPVLFSGTAENPVFVTCRGKNKYWGGFITRESGGTIEAHYAIFCRSGYHNSDAYAWGHAGRQALFFTKNSTLTLDHCYMTDHIGQIFYPQNAALILDDILVQRAKTGGQVNYSDLTLRNSVFTDFPDDSYVFQDNDNDALYLNASDADIYNTVFMFAKDDGLDSGGDEGGNISITDCWFEACFHEGAALSSSNTAAKNHIFTGCVFTNCGQGLELGFSSPNHSVTAENCMFLRNGVGIRYGDNYTWSEVNGKMFIKNSSSLNNDKDVWNMIRMTWSPELENMSFENTVVSHFCPQYPALIISD